jgi:hypothetical protein
VGKTGRNCGVCGHRERSAIDLAISRGVSITAISKRSGLHPDALYRHSKNHLPAQLRAKLVAGPDLDGIDLPRLRETESQSLLLHLVNLRHRLFAALDAMEEFGDAGGLTSVSAQLHRNLEITGKLLGDLAVGSSHVTNILVSPAYVEARGAIVGALRGFPEAARAVAAALHGLESRAADEIRADTSRQLATLPTKDNVRRAAKAPVVIEHDPVASC